MSVATVSLHGTAIDLSGRLEVDSNAIEKQCLDTRCSYRQGGITVSALRKAQGGLTYSEYSETCTKNRKAMKGLLEVDCGCRHHIIRRELRRLQ